MSRLQIPVPSSRPQSITVSLVSSPLTESLCRNTGPLKRLSATHSLPHSPKPSERAYSDAASLEGTRAPVGRVLSGLL